MFGKKKKPIEFPKIKVEQRYVDKVWGDSIMRILALSKDGKECRYIWEVIEGRDMSPRMGYTPSTHTTTVQHVLDNYQLISE